MTHMKISLTSGFLALTCVMAVTPGFAQDTAASVDPVTQEDFDVLTRSGIIERQARIGGEILIIEREIRRVQQIQSLIELIGHKGVVNLYPEFAEVVQGTPLEMRAQLREALLEKSLNDALMSEVSENDEQVDAEAIATLAEDQFFGIMDAPVVPRPGSNLEEPEDHLAMNFEEALEETRLQIMAELEAELDRRVNPEDAQAAQPISLREIYGSPGDLRAVIFHGSERVQIREGDTLPGGVSVITIGPDFVDLDRYGYDIRLSLRG